MNLARAEALREEAERKQSEAAAENRAAVRELLGLSFQRVNQLAN